MPVIAPVIDYSNVINHSVLGGEVSYKTNFTNLTRENAVFDPINDIGRRQRRVLADFGRSRKEHRAGQLPAARHARHLHAAYRVKWSWRRSFTDSAGEIWTPFASVRADAINASISNQPGVSNFLPVGDTQALRVMPTVGLEYRYPFINVQPWGTTTIEPIAQVIIRPNESYAGKLPNEDAQSMVFDTSNLFSVDKFSGYDRVEGGGRANAGVQATTQFDRGGAVTAVFGQSYQLFGLNSFAVQDVTNTGGRFRPCRPRNRITSQASAIRPTGLIRSRTRARFDRQPGASSASRPKAGPISTAGRSACCTATTPLSRISDI